MYRILFLLILVPTYALSESFVLPEISSITCLSPEAKKSTFWYELHAHHIDGLLKSSKIRQKNKEILKNQLITLSYLELYNTREEDSASSMGYVYAHASHHLGRLVRYPFWKERPEIGLGKSDLSLINGSILSLLLKTFPSHLSKRLMAHSLDLYKTLIWSLRVRAHCGANHVRALLHDQNQTIFENLNSQQHKQVMALLKEAHEETTPLTFMEKFVRFEQTYLQFTMYSRPEIRLPAFLKVLDKMRFIPFNGEKQTSYFQWCLEHRCETSSLNLKKRIEFDQISIAPELLIMSEDRLKNSGIMDVSHFILTSFCFENRLPGRLCP